MNFIWMDLETTGLNPEIDRILEVAVVVTTENLQALHEYSKVVYFTEAWVASARERSNAVVRDMHTKNGLWEELSRSSCSLGDIAHELVELIRCHSWKGPPMLAGSSVHFDRSFLRYNLPDVERLLHYRNFDVSVLKTASEAWGGKLPPRKTVDVHRALPDVLESIEVARFYRPYFDLSFTRHT